jgi:hypothetical protein
MKRLFAFISILGLLLFSAQAFALGPFLYGGGGGGTGNLTAGTMGGAGKVCTEASGTVIDCNSNFPTNATTVNGGAVPTSAPVTGTDSNGRLVDASGGLKFYNNGASISNNGTITLPTMTSGWPMRCTIEVGDDTDSAMFSIASGGTATAISTSSGIVFNATTTSKIQIGGASPANPLIITNASGSTKNIWLTCTYK